ncbi:MAG: CHAT domain-containing protein, partial [Desulfobacterales bacterium]|nr:CHAT domain-containing protein [Desulfobacterales bacterium]
MTNYADLEIGLHRRDVDAFGIQMRFSQPGGDSDTSLLRGSPIARFDFKALQEQILDDSRYGRLLYESLFEDSEVKSAFTQARDNARSMDAPLRLRLFIWSGASDLHTLRWETLHAPEEDAPLLAGERILFSRYLSSFDWRPARLLARSDLAALAVIANPANLSEYNLAPVDVEGELERAKAGLAGIRVTALAGEEKPALNNISAKLREGCDVLYLVCHGALIKGEPQLWLEDEAGKVARTPGAELVNRIKELQKIPRLVVLASCQSAGGEAAGAGDGGALAALGPRLAEAGVPAVLAMQGNITMETAERFMKVFFKELQRDGQIDRAMAVARGAVRDRPDWWMPVLFMRLKGGRLWYTARFTKGKHGSGEDKWPKLIDKLIEE